MRLTCGGKRMGHFERTRDIGKDLLDQVPAIGRQILGHDARFAFASDSTQ